MYKVYVLVSMKDGSLYTGITTNLRQRVIDHNSGSSKYSNTKRPLRLVWYSVFSDKRKAFAFEKYLKQGSGFAFVRKHFV